MCGNSVPGSNDIRLVPLGEHHLDDNMKDWNTPEMRKLVGCFIPHTREYVNTHYFELFRPYE